MVMNALILASLLSPLAFWMAAPRRATVAVTCRAKAKRRSY